MRKPPPYSLSWRDLVRLLLSELTRRCLGIIVEVHLFVMGLWILALDNAGDAIKYLKGRLWLTEPSASRTSQLETSDQPPSAKDANAAAVSFMRYVATFHDPVRLDPNLQRYESLFLSKRQEIAARAVCGFRPLVRLLVEEYSLFLACRTALFDALFLDAILNRGVTQILILGAGYDTRAYRFAAARRQRSFRSADLKCAVTVLEVDRSVVQDRKRRLLRERLPPDEHEWTTQGVNYLACDFKNPNGLEEALKRCNAFDGSLSTFVLWEGVSYYLEQAAVNNVLHTLTRLQSGGHWSLAFDFADAEVFNVGPGSPRTRLILRFARHANEPIVFGFPSDKQALSSVLEPFNVEVIKVWHCFEVAAGFFPRLKTAHNLFHQFIAQCEWS